MPNIPIPQQEISPKAMTIWRIKATCLSISSLLIVSTLLYIVHKYNSYLWMKITLIGLLVYLSFYALFSITIKPYLTYRNWRYEIRNDVIQITNGYLNKAYIIIPIVKVEYVTTHQGPLLRHFNLTSITIRTVTSTHTIPALRKDEALQLCNDIALLAKLYDDQKNGSDIG